MHSGNNVSNEKAKDSKKALLNLWNYCASYRLPVLIAIVLAALSAILTIITPDKVKDITDAITSGLMTGIDTEYIKDTIIVLVIILLFSFIFNYVQVYIMAVITNRFAKRLRNDIDKHINKLPLKYFDNQAFGDILSRVTNDVDTIGQTLNNSVANLVSAVVLLIGLLIMMFITNWVMAITAIVSSLIGFVLMGVIMGKSQIHFVTQQKELGNINGFIEEVYSGHNVVKAYNAKLECDDHFDEINNRLYTSARKSQFLSGLMGPMMNFIGNFGYVAICIVGAALVINDQISMGVIVSFMIYTRLFTSPLSTIAQAATQLQATSAASERVFDFLAEVPMDDEKTKTKKLLNKDVLGNITFEHVKFGYNKDKTIIKDFSADVKAGEKIAIIGPTGAGKTTLVNLLMRFYEINDGHIYIDGVDYQELTRDNIHQLFCMVLQDTWVFEGTIKENIAYNKTNVTDKQINEAIKTVGLDHFIKSLPNGINTVLGDVDSLSAGQKQLLTIARGMIEDAPFLILDEATSSVDTRTEELVQKAMDILTKGRTSFIIAHRLSTIKNADLILVMQEGNIVETGKHEALLKKNGVYAELYNSQFDK